MQTGMGGGGSSRMTSWKRWFLKWTLNRRIQRGQLWVKGAGEVQGRNPFCKVQGPFHEKEKEYFTFFVLSFLSSASRPEKVRKANTIYCVPDINPKAFHLNPLH